VPRSWWTSSWIWRRPGGADRLTVGNQPAVGIHRQGTADFGGPVGDQLLPLTVGAEATLGHMDDLTASVGVLELDDVDILGADTGLFIGRSRCVHRGGACSSTAAHNARNSKEP
jgi:hypothetical protein